MSNTSSFPTDAGVSLTPLVGSSPPHGNSETQELLSPRLNLSFGVCLELVLLRSISLTSCCLVLKLSVTAQYTEDGRMLAGHVTREEREVLRRLGAHICSCENLYRNAMADLNSRSITSSSQHKYGS